MRVPVAEAETQLTDLIRRAKAGEDIVLTQQGQPEARLVPVEPQPETPELRRKTAEEKRKFLDEFAERMRVARLAREARGEVGESAARSQDFLYDEDGLPK